MVRKGYSVFNPSTSWLAAAIAPLEIEQWLDMDLGILSRCDAIYRLPGNSEGADWEVQQAELLAIPVFQDLGELYAKMPTMQEAGVDTDV